MYESEVSAARPKFTKGEKCILAHLLLTITLTVILLIIYLVHIFISDHSGLIGAFDTRRSFLLRDSTELRKVPIGLLLYEEGTAIRSVCNTLLLTRQWSASTGHCVALRSDPHLAYLLFDWRIKYPYHNTGLKILRSIVHPHFNRDTFANNIGLLRHQPVKEFQYFKVPEIKDNYNTERTHLALLNWDHISPQVKDGAGKEVINNVQTMEMENCTFYVSPITELRIYEFCIVLEKKFNTFVELGAAVVDIKYFNVFGILTWGDRENKILPLVVLNLTHFKDWIESVTLLMPIHG